MIPVISIRPAASGLQSVARAQALGIALLRFPLSEARPLAWSGPDPDAIDALLVGSANAFRHGGGELQRYKARPVYAVGSSTAEAAKRHGFAVTMAGEGGLQALLDRVETRPVRLLRLAGKDHVPLAMPDGVSADTRVVYTLDYLPMPGEMVDLLASGAVVMLHSAGSAAHLLAECERLGIDRSRVMLAALGPRIVAEAGDGWGAVRWAEKPSEAALLALARDMCH